MGREMAVVRRQALCRAAEPPAPLRTRRTVRKRTRRGASGTLQKEEKEKRVITPTLSDDGSAHRRHLTGFPLPARGVPYKGHGRPRPVNR